MKSKWLLAPIALTSLYLCSAAASNEEFETWKKKQNSSFNSYLNDEQAAFKKALESEWDNFLLSQPEQQFRQPKFDIPPTVKKTPEAKDKEEPLRPEPESQIVNHPISEPATPRPSYPATTQPDYLEIDYIGRTYLLPNVVLSYLPLKADGREISNAWESLYPDLASIADYVSGQPELMKLSDWGLISLLERYSSTLSHGDENGGKLLLWALLMELGFDCRIAHDQSHLYVLMPSRQKIYGKPSLSLNKEHFYVLTGKAPEDSLYTHTTTLEKSKVFDFSFQNQLPIDGIHPETKHLVDSYGSLSVTYQAYPQLASYYRSHPSLDFIWYFKALPDDNNYNELVNNLKLKLDGLPELAKVNHLLSLVQHGFKYLRDDEQWGEEYYATPMHTLMLEAVDCEDRSFLYSFLVEQVTGLRTVGLKYPGHLAVAVELSASHPEENADFVIVNGRRFYVSDPTYIGASVGQAMPMFDGVTPVIINKEE